MIYWAVSLPFDASFTDLIEQDESEHVDNSGDDKGDSEYCFE